jgi:hypothetical protein
MRRSHLSALVVFALFALGLPMCGKSLVHIPVTGLGEGGEAKVDLSGGTKVLFALYADSYSYSGQDDVLIEARFLKDGKKVGEHKCVGMHLKGGSGAGCGGTKSYNSDCETTVPSGGADAVKVKVSLRAPGSAEMKGIEVDVRQM